MEFPAFRAWCQKVTPIVYDNSLTHYEILNKVITLLNEMVNGVNGVNTQITANTGVIETLKTELAIINREIERVKNGDYISVYIEELEKWIDVHLTEYVARIAKFVSFGLTDDGHFAAYIPENWDFLKFDTISDPDNANYGCLVLRY